MNNLADLQNALASLSVSHGDRPFREEKDTHATHRHGKVDDQQRNLASEERARDVDGERVVQARTVGREASYYDGAAAESYERRKGFVLQSSGSAVTHPADNGAARAIRQRRGVAEVRAGYEN